LWTEPDAQTFGPRDENAGAVLDLFPLKTPESRQAGSAENFFLTGKNRKCAGFRRGIIFFADAKKVSGER
jgi:hypothetical protein